MPRAPRLVKYALLAILLVGLYLYTRNSISYGTPRRLSHLYRPDPPHGPHPIDKLISDAQLSFAELTSKESKTLRQAAEAYRKRRGRHPPPGFENWFAYAHENKALIVEDFFDPIYNDLEPFWGLEPATLRKESWDWEMVISIRDGKASSGSDWFWTTIWIDLIKTVEHLLPDMDLSLNPMDEPRLVVPWEDLATYKKKAAQTAKMAEPKEVISTFKKLPPPGEGDEDTPTRAKDFEETNPYWKIAQRGCAPESPARKLDMQDWEDKRPPIQSTYAESHMHKGYVSNFTLSSDICHQPDLQNLEGIFIEPLSTSATKVLWPMFGGSKLSVNNEILLPAPMYWAGEERFTGGDDHGIDWIEKKEQVIWRGVATGGKNTEHNWRGFQRHRFVAMNNATTVSRVEKGEAVPENFALAEDSYGVQAQQDGKLGEWIGGWSNISFTDLFCQPPQADGCDHTGHYYENTTSLNLGRQFDSKYVPDIDGNSFSGRYLAFLRSTSLPIKATVWREWHDGRLVPWKHFVPMDNRFVDWFGIMEYFIGYQGRGGHDHAAEKIASDGKEWAEKVLRNEDMSIYTLRLLLEYGRLLDDEREKLGWVGDILEQS